MLVFPRPARAATTILPYEATGYKYLQVSSGNEPAGWQNESFNDSAWSTGDAAFGSGGGCPLQPTGKTHWDVNTDILLRKAISLPAGTSGVTVNVAVDNDINVYWNGTQVGSATHDGCPAYNDFAFSVPDNLLASGSNLLAVEGIDRGAESFIDVSVSAAASAFHFTATFGETFTGLVAKLHPPGGPGNLSQESATISWGDGSVTATSLSIPSGNPGELDVAGTHTYWTPGQLPAASGPPVEITLTNSQTGTTQRFDGSVVVASRYVGMGDSYSAGEGAGWPPTQANPNLAGCDWPLYHDPQGFPQDTDHIDGSFFDTEDSVCAPGPPPQTGDVCHRAPTAFDHVLDALLRRGGLAGLTLDPVACSGGVVNNAYLDGNTVFRDKKHSGERPQLSWLATDTSLVTLTMGGNNLGFAGIAANCVSATLQGQTAPCVAQDQTGLNRLGYNTTARSTKDGSFTATQEAITATGLTLSHLLKFADRLNGQSCAQTTCFPRSQGQLHDDLVLLFRAIKARAPGSRTLVLGYPRWFSPSNSNCEHFTPLDQTWLNDRIQLADSVIADAPNHGAWSLSCMQLSQRLTSASSTAVRLRSTP